jgi:iron complex outermembrane recepter protein
MRLALVAAVCLSMFGLAVAADAQAAMTKMPTNIPAQGLGPALKTLAKDRGFQVVFRSEVVGSARTQGASGNLTTPEALTELLKGTDLSYSYLDENTVTIVPLAASQAAAAAGSDQTNQNSTQDKGGNGKNSSQEFLVAQVDQTNAGPKAVDNDQSSEKKKKEEGLSEIVVTGTLIHGADPLSPLITITHDEMLAQGYSRLDQAIEQLPQNFLAGASAQTNPTNGLGENATANYSRGSGVNLRGLGTNATLVLLNGQRLPMSNSGHSVDISMIPVSIIDRVEILTDGASATYGADAVAGVVNIITRNDYSGVELGARDTNLSNGKAPNPGGYGLGGLNWSGGNFVINYDFEKDHPLYARDRSYTSQNGDPTTILPEQKTSSVFSALHQDLGAGFAVSSNLLFGRRDYSVVSTSGFNGFELTSVGDSKQFSGGIQLDYNIDDWHASLAGHYAKETGTTGFDGINRPRASQRVFTNRDTGADARLDRTLFELPGGASRGALGATFRSEAFGDLNTTFLPLPVSASVNSNARNSRSVFGELLFPLVGKQMGIPLVKQLTLDVAGRYDHYSDFGSTTNPKVALKWDLVDGLSFHAVYGRSFRVPTLMEDIPTVFGAYVFDLPDPKSTSGITRTLLYGNIDPHLQPERARSINAGLSFAPLSMPDLKIDVSYFDVRFTNKIQSLNDLGFFDNVLTNESELGSLVARNPSLAQVNAILNEPGQIVQDDTVTGFANPNQIKAMVNIGNVNAAIVHPRGLDFASHYRFGVGDLGHVSIDGSASYYINFEDQISQGAASFSAINMPYLPTRFRGKIQVGWDHSGLASYSRINFANAYSNSSTGDPRCAVSCPVASYTTVDAGISYSLARREGSGYLAGIRLSLDVSNVFDRAPPYVYDQSFNNYDPTNASALQRAFSFAIIKAF